MFIKLGFFFPSLKPILHHTFVIDQKISSQYVQTRASPVFIYKSQLARIELATVKNVPGVANRFSLGSIDILSMVENLDN